MNSKVVVFGGSGFLGSHVADCLSDRGYKVTIFDKRPSPWLRKDQTQIVGDITSKSDVAQALVSTQFVYNFAGIADIGEAVENPLLAIQQNVYGNAVLLDACVNAGIERFMLASTVYVYSDKGSFYRASKLSAEAILEAYHEKYDLDFTVLRFGSLYGPRAQSWNAIHRYMEQALRTGTIDAVGTGEEIREYIHVSDAARLSVDALSLPFRNERVILTGSQPLSVSMILKMIQEVVGPGVDIKYTAREKDPHHYTMTPYRFAPKAGQKLVANPFVDIGQGLLSLASELYEARQKNPNELIS